MPGKLKARTTKKRGEKPKTEIVAKMPTFGAFKHGKYASELPAMCRNCQFGGNEDLPGTNQCPKYDPHPEAVCTVRKDIAEFVAKFDTTKASDLRALVDIKLKELTVSTTFSNLANMWNGEQSSAKDSAAINTWIRMAGLAKDLQPKMSVAKKIDSSEPTELSGLVNALFTPAAEEKKNGKTFDTVVEIKNDG